MNESEDPFDGLIGSLSQVDWCFRDDPRDTPLRRRVEALERRGGLDGSMLMDDLDNLLPYRDGNSPRTVELSIEDQALRTRIAQALPTSFDYSYSLSDATRDAVEQIARDLVIGPTMLEIEFFHDDRGVLQAPFRIHITSPGLVARRRGKWIRYVPAMLSDARHRGLPYVAVSQEHVLVDLPKDMRRTLDKTFRMFESPGASTFLPVDMLTESREPTFEMAEYERIVNSYLRAKTNGIGWDGRGRLLAGMLEPYRAWRALRFAAFRVRMRDIIVDALQQALTIAGRRLDFECDLRLVHVPTLRDIEEGMEALVAGRASIGDSTKLAYGLRPL